MPKKVSVLRLVPSGASLKEVARNVELLAALSGALMLAIFRKHPEVIAAIVADLRMTQNLPRLTTGQKEIFAEALEIVERFAVEAANDPL